MWGWILVASAIAYLTKLSGSLVPRSLLDQPLVSILSASVTVGLLTSLVVVTTFVSGTAVVLDARVASLIVAAIALWFRAPFLLVVVLGAVAAAVARSLGM